MVVPFLTFCRTCILFSIVATPVYIPTVYEGSLFCIYSLTLISGEGNGTPLQYSCLENPMDGGAW